MLATVFDPCRKPREQSRMTTLYLEPRAVPDVFRRAFPHYSGRKFQVRTAESVTLHDNYWSGGTKSDYMGVNLASGEIHSPECSEYGNPFVHPDIPTVRLAPGLAIVEHSRFCGKDMGIVIHVHPDNLGKLLPAPTALSEPERIVLWATRSFKAGYGGDPENRYHEARRETSITRDDWTRGKAMAVEKGLLDKRGAITVAGRNAIADIGYCGYPKPAAQPAAPTLACGV
jgi:hypothetical protein